MNKPHTQLCPTCGAAAKIWIDQWKVINWQGCLHVENLVEVEGCLQLEFAQPK